MSASQNDNFEAARQPFIGPQTKEENDKFGPITLIDSAGPMDTPIVEIDIDAIKKLELQKQQ